MSHANIWNKVLSSNEEVKYEFSIGKGYKIVLTIIGLFFALMFLVGGAVKTGMVVALVTLFFSIFYLKAANAYAFTNKRVVIHRGWLSTNMISIDYDKITDVKVSEPIISRLIMRTGSLVVNTAGSIGDEVILKNISTPYETKKKLDVLRHG